MKAGLALAVTLLLTVSTSMAEGVRLATRESLGLLRPGASAAFAVDPTIVEVSLADESIVLVGLSPGETVVSIVLPDSVASVPVRVVAAAPRIPAAARAASGSLAMAAIAFDSGSDRLGADLSMQREDGSRVMRSRLQVVHDGWRESRSIAVPAASLEWVDEDRRVTLLDSLIEDSALGYDGSVLRGAHYSGTAFELHAGAASSQPWDEALLPTRGDRAASVAWSAERGQWRFVPSLMWLPDSDTDVPGVIRLGVRRGKPGDSLSFAADVGWSDRPGASFDLALHRSERQLWLRGSHRPAGFAALDVARPAGTYFDGLWSERLGERTHLTISAFASRLQLAERDPLAVSSQVDLRHALDPVWTVSGGLGFGEYREAGEVLSRRRSASLGAEYQGRNFGASAQYRYLFPSGAVPGGSGGRLALRAHGGNWRGSLHLDAQRHAPGLDLLLPPGSDVARAFAELGLAAGSPEQVLRLLQQHSDVFEQLGVSIGALRVAPLRLNAGLDLVWQHAQSPTSRIGVRLLGDDARGYPERRRSLLATVFASWSPFEDTGLELAYSRWGVDLGDDSRDSYGSFLLTLRRTFGAIPWSGSGRRAIRGRVLMRGAEDASVAEAAVPLAGVELVLDGVQRTISDAEGRYVFATPGPGTHQVVATLPAAIDAYFTAASTRRARAGEEVDFAAVSAPAHVVGRVLSDAGQPLASVAVRLRGSVERRVSTDSAGVFRLAVAAEALGRV